MKTLPSSTLALALSILCSLAAQARSASDSGSNESALGLVPYDVHPLNTTGELGFINTEQGWDVVMDPSGVEIRGASADRQGWSLELSLSSWGRPSNMWPAAAALPSGTGVRAQLDRSGLDEWFVNSARGLEQGFDIHDAPVGTGPLRLVLSIGGEFQVELDGARAASFVSLEHSLRLGYTDLHSWDATGRDLNSHFERCGSGLAIVVDDADAIYPVTVDPLIWTQDQKLYSLDTGYQGRSISVAGDTMIVGSGGPAVVYRRINSQWVFEYLLDPVSTSYSGFGYDVDVEGDTAIVGAPFVGSQRGDAHVFTRSGTTWSFQASLTSTDSGEGYHYGNSVAISGNTIVVGAPDSDVLPQYSVGSVHVWVGAGANWSLQQFFVPTEPARIKRMGSSIDIDGDTILVGARTTLVGSLFTGAAFIYTRTGTNWSPQAELTMPGTTEYAGLGSAVALAGERALVTAPSHASSTGRAGIWERNGGAWPLVAELIPASTLLPFDRFGLSADLKGAVALVGAPFQTGTDLESGVCYIFRESAGSWVEEKVLVPLDGKLEDRFGLGVALSADQAMVGAPNDNIGPTADRGSVYVYTQQQTTGTPYCMGNNQAPCPCGNVGGPDTGCANSTALGAFLVGTGVPAVGADTFQLYVEQCPAHVTGLFFSAPNSSPGFAFGDGMLCVGGAITRLGIVSTSSTGIAHSMGSLSLKEGLLGGELRNYQYWYRDTSGPCGSGFNTTNGLSVQW